MPVTAFIRSLSQRFSRNRQQQLQKNKALPLPPSSHSAVAAKKVSSSLSSSGCRNDGVTLGVENVAMFTSTASESVSLASTTFTPGSSRLITQQKLQTAPDFAKRASSHVNSAMTPATPRFVDPNREFLCKVQLLDGTVIELVLPRKALARELYDHVFGALELEERDYFGLQFVDSTTNGFQQWLDPLKKIAKQLLPVQPPYTFYFRVKFYSSEPNNLKEEFTRYQFFLQLKIDILTGRLDCSTDVAVELAALSLQSEFGDYSQDLHDEIFVSEFRFHPQQNEAMELAILDHYREKCNGLSPEQSERAYLNKVKWLEFYGVDMHQVQGCDGNQYSLGLTPSGMLVFDGRQKIGLFLWEKIQRLDFKDRKITLVVEEDDSAHLGQIQLHTFVFNLSCAKASKHFWKCAIEHHMFFRLKVNKAPKQRPSATAQFFRLGSTFKYRGRTEFENVHQDGPRAGNSCRRKKDNFERRSSQRFAPRESHLMKKHRQQPQRHSVIVALDDTGNGQVISPMDIVQKTIEDFPSKSMPSDNSLFHASKSSKSSIAEGGAHFAHSNLRNPTSLEEDGTCFSSTGNKGDVSGTRIPTLKPAAINSSGKPALEGPSLKFSTGSASSGYESGSLNSMSASASNIPRATPYVTTIRIKEFGISNGIGVLHHPSPPREIVAASQLSRTSAQTSTKASTSCSDIIPNALKPPSIKPSKVFFHKLEITRENRQDLPVQSKSTSKLPLYSERSRHSPEFAKHAGPLLNAHQGPVATASAIPQSASNKGRDRSGANSSCFYAEPLPQPNTSSRIPMMMSKASVAK